MNKKLVGLLVVLLVLVGATAVFAMTASTPVSDAGITPYIIAGDNPGGNRTCAEVGTAFYGDPNYYELTTGKIDYDDGAFDGSFPFPVSTDGTYVSWGPLAHSGLAAIVKGSNDANVYVYVDGSIDSDSGLSSPPNASGNPAGLSNLTFCWNPPPVVEEGQWCSPGYWRQQHHLDSWAATGISPDELYSAYFGAPTLSNQGVRNNANPDPTLWEVLQSPNWYGGEAFNNVGDLLSAAHPDVNFDGERVEDSCPLN